MGEKETEAAERPNSNRQLPFPFEELHKITLRAHRGLPKETSHLQRALKLLGATLSSLDDFNARRYSDKVLPLIVGEVYDASLAAYMLLSLCLPQQAAAVLRSAYESFINMEIILQDPSQGARWAQGNKLKEKIKTNDLKWARRHWYFLSNASHVDPAWRSIYSKQPSPYKIVASFGVKNPEVDHICLHAMRSIAWRLDLVVVKTARKVSTYFEGKLDLDKAFCDDLDAIEHDIRRAFDVVGQGDWT